MAFRRLYLGKQQYIHWFNLNYSIETTCYASLWHQFNSPTSKYIPALQLNFEKFLLKTTILGQQNNKQKLDSWGTPYKK